MTTEVVSRVLGLFGCSRTIAGLCVLSLTSAALAVADQPQAPELSDSAFADEVAVPSTASALSEQRYHYNLAKSALESGKRDAYQKYHALLGDYPLVPYLDYRHLRSKLWTLPYDQVDQFLDEQAGSFLAMRLRQVWLARLAAEGQWQSYIDYYRSEVADTELKCHYLNARLETGDTSALQEAPSVWDIGESQPEACDPVFSAWRSAGLLTQELIWSRFDKAMQRRNLGLARYLAAMLTGREQSLAQLYMQVDRSPALMKRHERFREQSEEMQQVIAHGITRLARWQAKQALVHWEFYEAQQLFAENTSRDTKVTLVRYLTRQGHHRDAEQLLQSSTALRQTDVVEELIREALREMDWAAVERRIRMLPLAEQQSDRWIYWRARAYEQLSFEETVAAADPRVLYEAIAERRSFYGFLAADILGRDYALEDVPAEVRPAALQEVAQMPGMRRAKELWLTGNRVEAQAEWLHTTGKMSQDELVSAGQLARQWGWYNKGIHAMIAGNLWDHLTIRFPLAYQETVTRVATDAKLEPTLIYAIARQESAFAEAARSPAGAMGLMQLMPSTAEQTARSNGLKHTPQDLYNPEHNILLGSTYLNSLLKRFDNNRILATAAYNAGPHRVARWISEPDEARPFDVWIETIPFRETRGYVQNVLSFSVIYGYRLGQAPSLITAEEAEDLL